MTPFEAELLGTFLLILIGGGVCANVSLKGTNGFKGGWIVVTTAWALGVYIGVVVAAPHSGAHLNPAVTVGLAVIGKFEWSEMLSYSVAQLIGAMLGALFVWLFYKDHFSITEDGATKRGVFCTAPSIRNLPSNFFSEAVGAFVLMTAVFNFTDAKLADTDQIIGLGSIGAIPVAFVVWAIGLALGGTTGYAINPVRDLGPRIMHAILPIPGKTDNDWGYAWVPVLGPIVGSIVAGGVYLFLN